MLKMKAFLLLLVNTGRVVDISFAHLDIVIIGMVDEAGGLHVYEIQDSPDGKIETTLLLLVNRPENTIQSENHRFVLRAFQKKKNRTIKKVK